MHRCSTILVGSLLDSAHSLRLDEDWLIEAVYSPYVAFRSMGRQSGRWHAHIIAANTPCTDDRILSVKPVDCPDDERWRRKILSCCSSDWNSGVRKRHFYSSSSFFYFSSPRLSAYQRLKIRRRAWENFLIFPTVSIAGNVRQVSPKRHWKREKETRNIGIRIVLSSEAVSVKESTNDCHPAQPTATSHCETLAGKPWSRCIRVCHSDDSLDVLLKYGRYKITMICFRFSLANDHHLGSISYSS